MEKKKLDMSLGNPLHPFKGAARHAFAQATQDLHCYRFMNLGNSDPEIRATYEAISDHFEARGIKAPGWSGLSFGHFTMTGGGTTEAYNLVMQLLADDIKKQNRQYNRNLKPAIIMPVPTYGFFFGPADRAGIETITLNRSLKNGQVSPQQLIKTIRKAHADGYRIVAFFDSNPNNPMGTIRDEKQTRALARIFMAMRTLYENQDNEALTEWRKTQPSRKAKVSAFDMMLAPGRRWDGPASRVRIIDDMVYDGLEYGDKKAFAFAQIPEMFEDTFTLAGPSKAGLASIRGGIIIGHDRDIRVIEEMRRENNYFPPRPTLAAMEAFYSMKEPFKTAREKHMTRLNRDHRLRGLFMKALINGIDTLDEASTGDQKKIISLYARLEKCTPETAASLLKRGIKNIKVITRPEAGFFHMVDFSAMRGYTFQSPRHHGEHDAVFKDNQSLKDTLGSAENISCCTAAWMGVKDTQLMTRATFATSFEDILEYTKRLRRVSAMLKPPVKTEACCAASNTALTL